MSCDFVAQQKLQVALKYFIRNFYHATSDKRGSCCSHVRCYYESKCTQLRKIDSKSFVGAFRGIMALLVLCESAYGKEIVVNGPGNELGVDLGFEFITGWYIRNCISAMKHSTGILTYGCSHFRRNGDHACTVALGPRRRRLPLIFRTTSRMKLEVVLFCATCCMRLATVQLFNIHGATFVTQQSRTIGLYTTVSVIALIMYISRNARFQFRIRNTGTINQLLSRWYQKFLHNQNAFSWFWVISQMRSYDQ